MKLKPVPSSAALYRRIAHILESARAGVVRTVNTSQVIANWLIGREIVEAEQRGKNRAQYGERLLLDLSARLQAGFGRGYSVDNLEWFRQFYLVYPQLILPGKSDAVRRISATPAISDAPSRKSTRPALPLIAAPAELEMAYAAANPAGQPGLLHHNLSWTHYRRLLRVALRPLPITGATL